MVAAYGGAAGSSAVAPHFIMLHGEPLSRQVFVTDPPELFQFMCALEGGAEIDAPLLEGRPFVSVSAFWGPPWVNYAANPRWQADIRADQANHHGRFYPAAQGRGAVFVSGAIRSKPVPEPKTLRDFIRAHPLSAECASVLQQFVARGTPRL
jgi:hypothetical protein